MLVGISIMRNQLLNNAKEMSTLLLDNYKITEEGALDTYKTLLRLATKFVKDKELENASIQDIKDSLYPYLDGFYDLFAGDSVRSYGIIDGHIISNDKTIENLNNISYDYRQTDWYKGAIEANGEVYISKGYTDYVTGMLVVTLSQRVGDTSDVIAFDVFYHDYHGELRDLDLPSNGAYYLCDSSGNVIYHQTRVYDNCDEIQKFATWALGYLASNETYASITNYTDAKGNARSGYIGRMNNGWIVILTVPQENSIGELALFNRVVVVISVLALVFIFSVGLRDLNYAKHNQLLLETKQIYQKALDRTMEIYREVCYLDLENNTYHVIYPDMRRDTETTDYETAAAGLIESGLITDDDIDGLRKFLSLENINESLRTQSVIERRCKGLNEDGTYDTCLLTITGIDYRFSQPLSATFALRSIEAILRQEQAQRELLEFSAKQAEAASLAKTDFLSNMSHDIRTPMNAILGMTDIAKLHIDDTKKVEDCLNKITISGKHLLRLINGVLDVSKIESGKITLESSEFNIIGTLDNLTLLFEGQMANKNLAYSMNYSTIKHKMVIGDEQRLSQIFINIVGNAVKFTPEGGEISVIAIEKDIQLSDRVNFEFVFQDNGIGMQPEFVEKIFEPFARAKDSRISKIEGSGLGMTISVNIARLMGGDIYVESTPGKGSKFTVSVYFKMGNNTDKTAIAPDKNDADSNHLLDVSKHNKDYSDKQVLLVEDNEFNVEVAKELLGLIGINVDVANNGKEAVDRLCDSEPGFYDIVFMDIQMPVMNGYEAAASIRSLERTDLCNIPIIAMTADAFADDVRHAMEAGMNGHIAKPIDVEKLEEMIERWVQ
jgi:signal transduction histidine kinase/CheY-like chemotaxis protein